MACTRCNSKNLFTAVQVGSPVYYIPTKFDNGYGFQISVAGNQSHVMKTNFDLELDEEILGVFLDTEGVSNINEDLKNNEITFFTLDSTVLTVLHESLVEHYTNNLPI